MASSPGVKLLSEKIDSAVRSFNLIKVETYKKYSDIQDSLMTPGQTLVINRVIGYGRYLIFEFNNGYCLVCHITTHADWRINRSDIRDNPGDVTKKLLDTDPSIRVILTLSRGNSVVYLSYSDTPEIGKFRYLSPDQFQEHIKEAGIDVFSGDFTFDKFCELIREAIYKHIFVGEILFDLHGICGINSMLRSEILHNAKIYPLMLLRDIKVSQARRLYESTKYICDLYYRNPGATPHIYEKNTYFGRPVAKCTFSSVGRIYYPGDYVI